MRTRALAPIVLISLSPLLLVGCGGSGTPAVHARTSSQVSVSPSARTTEETQPAAPQAVCDFKDTWTPLDTQLSAAEADLTDGALWNDTAGAFESVTGPEAIAGTWGPLVSRVRQVADAVDSGDEVQVQSVQASALPELKQLHTTVGQVFLQMCP